jgi:hypothetical protein
MSELRVTREPVRLPENGEPTAALGEGPFALVATRIEPGVLAGLQAVWRGGESLVHDGFVSLPGSGAKRRTAGRRGAALAVFPVFDGDRLAALLYLEGQEIAASPPVDLQRLLALARELVRGAPREPERPAAGDGWEAYLERTPIRDIERRKLSLLLDRNEWNISRVARILGVTRRTVYLRLQRYRIPRQHVSKSSPRGA